MANKTTTLRSVWSTAVNEIGRVGRLGERRIAVAVIHFPGRMRHVSRLVTPSRSACRYTRMSSSSTPQSRMAHPSSIRCYDTRTCSRRTILQEKNGRGSNSAYHSSVSRHPLNDRQGPATPSIFREWTRSDSGCAVVVKRVCSGCPRIRRSSGGARCGTTVLDSSDPCTVSR